MHIIKVVIFTKTHLHSFIHFKHSVTAIECFSKKKVMRIQELACLETEGQQFLRIIIKCDVKAAAGSTSDWITGKSTDLRLDCSPPSNAASSNR